ncbi:MAG: response regulator [Burkholderiaceae bacterium]
MRIRSHLLLLAAVVLLPGFLAAALAIAAVREGERQAALRGLDETVRATALLVDGQVQRSIGALTALAQSQHLQTGDLQAFYREAQAVDQPPHVWTLLLDETGTQRLNTAVPFGAPMPPPASLERVRTVLATQRPLVSDVLVGPATGKLVTILYLPAPPTPNGRFVVAQAFSIEHWKQTAMQPEGRGDWIVAVIDRNGKFISRSHLSDELLGRAARPELVAAAAGANEGMIRHSTLEGLEAYDSFTHSALTGWTVAVAAPVHAIDASATKAVSWLMAGLAVALALALGGASWLNRALIRAIDLASEAADALGRGRPPEPLQTSLDEVNTLGRALGDAGKLLAAEQAARAGVEAQREQLLDNERAARVAAQRENAAKDEFLALLGHELRNPLAAISGATEVLVRSNKDRDPRANRFVAIIQRQNRHLKQIVDDLLDVSRLLSGKIALDAHPLDLSDCVRRCIDALRATPAAVGRSLTLQAEPVWIDGDAVRIEQIVNNLVANALKFSPQGNEVRIRVGPADAGAHSDAPTHTQAQALIEVCDTGSGIAADLMPHIFEPFVQGPTLRGLQASGLGIGLALVRQLVELHGGTVGATSEGVDRGTVFTVSLPRLPTPAGTDEGAAVTSMGDLASARILLVEDNDDARETTAQMLREAGYQVAEAENGEAALTRLRVEQPDLVVLDLGMPGKDGFQVAVEIRAAPALRHLPLIALSGYGQERDRAASAQAGFDDHLVKPVLPQVLQRAIEAQLARRAPGALH